MDVQEILVYDCEVFTGLDAYVPLDVTGVVIGLMQVVIVDHCECDIETKLGQVE